MMIKTAACLLAVSLLAACTTTTTTTKRETLREMQTRYASNPPVNNEPASPAEGPEAVGAGPMDPVENPALLPSPLLRANAMGGL